jgi:NAD+ kinase
MAEYRTVGIVAKPHADNLPEILPQVVNILHDNGCRILIDDKSSHLAPKGGELAPRGDLVKKSEMVIVLGGDGTLLSLAKYLNEGEKPVLGINMGSLGFLTEVAVTEAMAMIQAALDNELGMSYRMMLNTELVRAGKKRSLQRVLNDVVINKSALARIFDVDVKIDGERITTIRADGLIVSTPTGSTAYNLAAQGPIVYPEMEVILVTPICPHMLTYRPVVLPAEIILELELKDSEETYLTLDGQAGFPLHQGDIVRVSRSSKKMAIFSPRDKSFFTVLRNKLKWGDR